MLQDAVLGWGLLKEGGLMCFDDYLWEEWDATSGVWHGHLAGVKPAVDALVGVMAEELTVVHQGYQVIVRKTSPAP